jgi:uncharacterized cupin superfamily protein
MSQALDLGEEALRTRVIRNFDDTALDRSERAPLKSLSLSTQEYPEVCEYPDSGKFMAWAWKDGVETLAEVHKSGSTLDYWDGEP